jgi:elongator complex protein 1
MLQFTDEHREEGKALQEELTAFKGELSRAIEEVWARPPPESESKDVATTSVSQNATGVGEGAKSQDPLDKIAKPQILEPAWRVTLWDRK